MTITNKTVPAAGANRGLGQALVTEGLARGASKVYLGLASPGPPDARVTPLSLDVTPAYSISKAATFNLTQSLRVCWPRGVRVHSVLTGPVDTEMIWSLDIPKAPPRAVARAIFDAVGNGEEDIFPDLLSGSLAAGWYSGVAKDLERQNAALVPQPSAA